MESLAPNFFVNDMHETMGYYRKLGFEKVMSVPEEGDEYVWVMMSNGSVSFMFQTMESLGVDLPEVKRSATGASLLFYIKLKNIRDFFDRVKDQVTVLTELEKTFYGATEFSILDCNGYVLTFAEHEAE